MNEVIRSGGRYDGMRWGHEEVRSVRAVAQSLEDGKGPCYERTSIYGLASLLSVLEIRPESLSGAIIVDSSQTPISSRIESSLW